MALLSRGKYKLYTKKVVKTADPMKKPLFSFGKCEALSKFYH